MMFVKIHIPCLQQMFVDTILSLPFSENTHSEIYHAKGCPMYGPLNHKKDYLNSGSSNSDLCEEEEEEEEEEDVFDVEDLVQRQDGKWKSLVTMKLVLQAPTINLILFSEKSCSNEGSLTIYPDLNNLFQTLPPLLSIQ